MNRLWAFLTGHSHHWGIPHRDNDGPVIQTCYACGKSRLVAAEFQEVGR